MNAYLELLRLNNGILAILGIIIGAIVADAFLPSMSLQIVIEINRDIFAPNRPIPSGRVRRKNVAVYFVVLIAASLALAYFVSRDFLYLAAINSLVSLVYSWKLKGMPLIGNLTVSWLAGSTFIGGALIVHPFAALPSSVLLLASIGFIGTLSREIFKDIEDVKGDKEGGAKTLPIAAGEKAARIAASAVLVIGILSLLIPLYVSMFSMFYYIGIVPAIAICLTAMVKPAKKSQKLIKIAMYFIFLGFVLGTVL